MNVSKLVIGCQYSYKGQQVIFDESHEEDENRCGFPIFAFTCMGKNGRVISLSTAQVVRDITEIHRKHPKAPALKSRKEEYALAE